MLSPYQVRETAVFDLESLRVPAAVVVACAVVAGSGCQSESPAPERESATAEVCFDCFWEHQPAELRRDLVATYGTRQYDDPLADAERRLILGRVTHDAALVCDAYRTFRDAREDDPERRLLAAESAAFLAAGCGDDPSPAFQRAARVASDSGEDFKAKVYREVSEGHFRPRFGVQEIKVDHNRSKPKGDVTGYVLGGSTIFVADGATVVMQAERTVRDWLSYQLSDDLSSDPTAPEQLLDWHEGARLQDLMEGARVVAHPVRGALAVWDGRHWMAADEQGVFRFEVLPDKLRYPSTRVHGRLAMLMDTHGIAAVERAAVRAGADLVVGCGDDPSKMQAAYRLAKLGIAVWFPTDRFVGEIVDHDAGAVMLGSAPVRPAAGGAIIGGTPVAFRVAEKMIVEDSSASGVAQYYDAAARYFRRLSQEASLNVEYQPVDAPGESARIVDRARSTKAMAIALRVATAADAGPVREWLSESRGHRAVLFHTVPYPAGAALFRDFPGQVTFGDPRPLWTIG